MDEIDRYTHLESEMVTKRIRQMRENLITASDIGAEHCEDCGMDIPMSRRKAIPTTIRCVGCQEDYES